MCDSFHQPFEGFQRQAENDKAANLTIIAFTLIVGYIVYYGFKFAGLPVEQITFTFQFHLRRMLGRLGVLPKQTGFAGPRRLSTGSQALDGALGGALAPLKAAAGDRTLGTLSSFVNRGSGGNAPPGLGNWDNSCYQNSVIQGLASLRPVDRFLASALTRHGNALGDSTNSTLFDLVRQLNDTDNNGRTLWMPGKLKSMSTWQQQDAQEYFSKILDEVDKELLRATKSSSTLPGLAEEEPAMLSRTQTNPMEGFVAQRVACMRCGHSEGLSMIPFNCLTVPLGRDYRYDLSDCLEEYTKLEAIEGVECAKCTLLRTKAQLEQLIKSSTVNPGLQTTVQGRLRAVNKVLESEDYSDKALTVTCSISKKNWATTTKSRQAVIARAPKSLVVHINRSVFNEMTGAQTKNYAEVSFPATLDLGPWCLGRHEAEREDWSMNAGESMLPDDPHADGPPQISYALRAVVTHYGRHENGHYICYRKHPAVPEDGSSKEPEERWWRLSDEDVSPVSEDDVLHQGGVFMLFYEQSEQHSPRSQDVDWLNLASIVPLPEKSDELTEVDMELDADRAITREGFIASNEAPAPRPELTEEQRAQAAALEASKSSLMAELKAALPSVSSEYELTAVGDGGDHAEISAEDASTDVTDDDAITDQLQPLPPLPRASASRVKMRTAGAGGKRRSSEALDSPLRMASAF